MRRVPLVAIVLMCLVTVLTAQIPTVGWAKSAGGTYVEAAYAIAADGSGNSFVAGYFQSPTVTIAQDKLINAGFEDMLLVKYDSSGSVVWARSAGGMSWDTPQAIAVDATGNSYIAGYYQSPSLTFGSEIFTNAGVYDFFLAKYDPSGNPL